MAEHRFIGELREFLGFLRSLWGLLAGVSLFFPLSNSIANVIPLGLGDRPFHKLEPAVVTIFCTIACIFVTFSTFSRRDQFGQVERRSSLSRAARGSFGFGTAGLAAFMLLDFFLYRLIISEGPDTELTVAIYDGLFAFFYCAFFVSMTRAFLMLALLEYARDDKESGPVRVEDRPVGGKDAEDRPKPPPS